LALLPAAWAQNPIVLESGQGVDSRTPIAVPPFVAVPGQEALAQEMAEAIRYDLEFTGLFNILMPSQYPPGFAGLDADVTQIVLDPWRQTPAEFLVYGLVTQQGDSIVAQFRLFDIISKQQVVGQELRAGGGYPRLVAHRFSEEVVRHLEGTPGIATSEIAFSVGSAGKKEIYVSDYDGKNMRQVTKHNSISIMPEISPDGNKIAYTSYKDRYGFIYIFDRRTGTSTLFSKEVGLNTAPVWSPDGNTIAMTLSKDANTEIYLKDVGSGSLRRLTNNRFGDTSPTYSPNGAQIAFVTDRGGNAQIYVMDVNGGNERRLSTQGGSSYDPTWSPDGKSIAYVVEKSGDGLEIYVMNADGSGARRLTNSAGTNEGPSWSVDSRHIIFSSSREGAPTLWSVNASTGEARKIPGVPGAAQGPSWGPRRN
jgi:TolB protein